MLKAEFSNKALGLCNFKGVCIFFKIPPETFCFLISLFKFCHINCGKRADMISLGPILL